MIGAYLSSNPIISSSWMSSVSTYCLTAGFTPRSSTEGAGLKLNCWRGEGARVSGVAIDSGKIRRIVAAVWTRMI